MPELRISERLRKDADLVWKEIFRHPFVTELYRGSLPMEKFRFYVLQDYSFLVTMMRNLAVLASRADSVPLTRELLEIAHLEATTEFASYEELLGKLGYALSDALKAEPSQVSVSYGSFLLAMSSLKTFWEGFTAILPCFWSYAEIAESHKDILKKNTNTLYTEWASVYLSEPYLALVDKLRRILDTAPAEGYEKLKEVFLTASRYELAYWDMAHKIEK